MDTLKPKDWLFLIPYPNEPSFLLYAPLHGLVTKLSQGGAEQLQTLITIVSEGGTTVGFNPIMVKFLTDNGLLVLPEHWSLPTQSLPGEQGITLSLTNDCNLRCIYCYAKAGCDTTTIPEDIAKNAILYALRLAGSRGRKHFTLTFHGGGESLKRKALLKACVLYALQEASLLGITLHVSIVTNATLITINFAQWLKAHNVDNITISLDGIATIQDLQRPMVGGKGSFKPALKGIASLRQAGLAFSIRATVTSKSVEEMPNFVRFLAKEVLNGVNGLVHFEPLSLCGKASGATDLDVDPGLFVRYYTEARKIGVALGLRVVCTLDTFRRDKLQFCGASTGTMFCVCPDGSISGCSRITKKQDPGSELFFYGSFGSTTQVPVMNPDAHVRIVVHGGLPQNLCSNCFARWNCQGFCPISRYLGENTFQESCIIVKQLLLQDMLSEF